MKHSKTNNDILIILLCVVFAINAVFSLFVFHHTLSLCSSLLQSMSLQCYRGHSLLSLVLHLPCPRGFPLCVPSLCSTPAQVLRSLQCLSLCLAFFVFVSLCVKKISSIFRNSPYKVMTVFPAGGKYQNRSCYYCLCL